MTTDSESLICLWLDQTVNTSKTNAVILQQLHQIVDDVRTFENSQQCEEFIRKMNKRKLALIVSGGFGRQIVPRIHELPQIIACYVFCQDEKANKEWASKYPKIHGVFSHSTPLFKQISKDQINPVKAADGDLCISFITSTGEDLQGHNADSMWCQLFVEILLRMRHKSSDQKELIDFFKKKYADDPEEMPNIEEFNKNYTPETAIQWYTRESCFYEQLNKSLREKDFDVLFLFRFFLTDLVNQIQSIYENFIRTSENRNRIQVYRGQLISIEELGLMKTNLGQFLSMNSFLSTSRDRSKALKFARKRSNRSNMQALLFEIEINPRLRTKAFADISGVSEYADEKEVLIMLGALFRINDIIENKNDHIWIARVSLGDEDDNKLKALFSHMKDKIGNATNLDSLGGLLIRIHENEKARRYYQRMLDESQLAVADAHLGMGWASLRCDADDDGIEHFEKSLEIRRQIHGEDHPSVAQCYGFFGEAYRKKGDQKTALSYLKKAMIIQEKIDPDSSLELAATYDTIGNTYLDAQQYDMALDYYKKTRRIRENNLPADHPQLATIYSRMAYPYECQNNHKMALECYTKALEINRKTLPSKHKHIIEVERNVRRMKEKVSK